MKHEKTNSENYEWYTPPYIKEALGAFDLDPCFPVAPVFEAQEKVYTKEDDGLSKQWEGRVWLNPPYGKECPLWMAKMAEHNNGTALIYSRTETKMFFNSIWEKASGIFFFKGRIRFYNPEGKSHQNSPSGNCLVSYGAFDQKMLKIASGNLNGIFLNIDRR